MKQETGTGCEGTRNDREERSGRAEPAGLDRCPGKVGCSRTRPSKAEGPLEWNPTQWLASSPLIRPRRVEVG